MMQQAPTALQQNVPKGALMGQTVARADPMSLVADAAEEATFAKSERDETRLEERKMRPLSPNTDRVDQIRKFMELMDKQGKNKALEAFIAALRNTPDLDARKALERAKEHFSDSADIYAALYHAGEELGPEELFHEAMAQLEDERGMDVSARLVAGAKALEYGELGSPDDLKNLYAGAVLDASSPMEVFERVMTDFGDKRFDEALDFLTRTLGDSMAATTSQTDKAFLESVAGDLESVRLLRGLNNSSKGLLARLKSAHGIEPRLSATQLTQELLKLRDTQFVGGFDIENLADKLGVAGLEHRILFCQDLSVMARGLPETLFPDSGGRLGIIDAVQMALDDAIQQESELYEDD
ncbi:type III secretion system gatekeeper subunit SctW [Desulfocurvus sp. DL9XJH121]